MHYFVRSLVAAPMLATLLSLPVQAQQWSLEFPENGKTGAFAGAQFRLPFGRKAHPATAFQLGFTRHGGPASYTSKLQANLVEVGLSSAGPSMKLVDVEMHRRDGRLGAVEGGGGSGADMLLLGGLAVVGGAAALASSGGGDDIADRGKACPAIYPPRC